MHRGRVSRLTFWQLCQELHSKRDFIFYAFLNSLWTLWAGEELNFKRESCRLELGAEVGCRSEADVRRVSASSGRFGQVE